MSSTLQQSQTSSASGGATGAVLALARNQIKAKRSPADFAEIASGGKYKRPWHINALNDVLMDAFNGKSKRLIITMGPRHGKALALDTLIPTPEGWTTMGELQIGDHVFGANGNVVDVIWVSPILHNRPVYAVHTNDGEEIIADADHLWKVGLSTGGNTHSPRREAIITSQNLANKRSKRPMVPCAGPLVLPDAELPINPYVLGVWLGDGTSANAAITSGMQDVSWMREQVTIYGYPTRDRSDLETFGVSLLQVQLRLANLINNKHVPSIYLRGSAEQRLELLQGLMDTDGTVSKEGQCTFANTRKTLSDAVYELVCSLGYKATKHQYRATLYGKDCGPVFDVSFYMPNCFRMPRKLARCIQPQRLNRYLQATLLPTLQDVRCITVSADDGMFLVGSSMLATHNSELVSKHLPAWWLGMRPDDRVMLTSYEHDLAASWGGKARDLLTDHGGLFGMDGIEIRTDSKASNRWDIVGHDGGMVTMGIGGALTGKGANCLTGETRITTECGEVALCDIIEGRCTHRVLSLSHEKTTHEGQAPTFEWCKVVATRTSYATKISELAIGNTILRSTPDHRIATVRSVPQVVPSPTMRCLEAALPWARRHILFSNVQQESSLYQASSYLPAVQTTNTDQNKRLLFGPSSSRLGQPSYIDYQTVSDVQLRLQAQEPHDAILLTDLRQQVTLDQDAWITKPTMAQPQTGSTLSRLIQKDEAVDSASRSQYMSKLPTSTTSSGGCTSYRPEQEQQRARESDLSLRGMSCTPSRITSIDWSGHSSNISQPVYDLQVEGPGNFFANRVCVHNCLIIDDYLRNSEDARSKLIRDKQYDWWTGTARTRLEPDGIVIIMATRWNQGDLIGRLLDHDAEYGDESWRVFSLPAIATYDEEFRKEGEALWPERYPIEELEAIKRDIGTYWFSAEFMCSPSPEDGLHYKRSGVRYWRRHPDGYMLLQANGTEVFMKDSRTWKFITVDLAASEKETADYTVIACWAVTPNTEMILVDLDRARYPGPEKIPRIKEMLAKHGAQYVAIEKTGFQLDFVKNARAAGLPCLELVAKGDKVERAIESTVKWESGMIYIPANASWTGAYEEELYSFNAGRHDDQVDVTAYAAIEVGKRGFASNYAYGLIECSRCKKLYTCTERTGLDRPCPQCGMVQEQDNADSFAVPVS